MAEKIFVTAQYIVALSYALGFLRKIPRIMITAKKA